jgi:hypothetical protein
VAISTVREKLLPVTAKLRALADTRMGLRRYTVYVRRETPSDGRSGLGAAMAVVDVRLVERPRIRQATTRDVLASAGRITLADFLMDRVTPRDDADTVGTAASELELSPDPGQRGQKVFLVLDGPGMSPYAAGPPPRGGGEFTITSANVTGNFGFSFVLTPRSGVR